jgi:hypothetical protein
VNGPSAPATVRVKRNGDSVCIDPWRIKLGKFQEVEWVLEGSDDEMTINAKTSGPPWPFEQNSPNGGKGRPARSGKMRENAQEGVHRYDIKLGSGADALTIDPEMIIPRLK